MEEGGNKCGVARREKEGRGKNNVVRGRGSRIGVYWNEREDVMD